jgi:hypothetical protein
VSVVDKRLTLITLWSLEVFEHKLNLLREVYSRHVEDEQERDENGVSFMSENSSIAANTESLFLTDSMDEWQTLAAFNENDAFSPRV